MISCQGTLDLRQYWCIAATYWSPLYLLFIRYIYVGQIKKWNPVTKRISLKYPKNHTLNRKPSPPPL